jgi:hypothetical protein
VFPLFVAERVRRRVLGPAQDTGDRLPAVSARADRLLTGLSRVDQRLLRHRDLPFGSSIFVVAVKPGRRS